MPTRRPIFEASNRRTGLTPLRPRRPRPLGRALPARHVAWAPAPDDDAVQQVLINTLRSACEVISARGGFAVILRDDTVFEIAGTHVLTSSQVLDSVLGPAAAALHLAIVERRRGLADVDGELLDEPAATPVIVSLPLELGQRRRGALCLLRPQATRHLRALDYEILDALAGQAALALGAACQRRALRRLEASLRSLGLPPLP